MKKVLLSLLLLGAVCTVLVGEVFSQEDAAAPVVAVEEAAGGVPEVTEEPPLVGDAGQTEKAVATEEEVTLWSLIKKGGILMWPIGFMSLLVVCIGMERFIALRSFFVIPSGLFKDIDKMAETKTDPRWLYVACRKKPSSAANVIQAVLMKAGRPMVEVQTAMANAKDDEAARLFGRVRLLVLAASVTPLMGLLGTVIGMIKAFMETAAMAGTVGVNRAEQLSQGIYVALVTTCAGLVVAIPAAILAHWYEGRIQRLFCVMDRRLLNFLSYMESLEGKVHVTPQQYEGFYTQAKKEKKA
ncbi:MAG: MotA/TolQ/ExbB proton channel family protein [Planctomycetia bacterium]|nr:MotA/TolQ/ExbB proton channel family protein [Planctomycetia bacterium]